MDQEIPNKKDTEQTSGESLKGDEILDNNPKTEFEPQILIKKNN